MKIIADLQLHSRFSRAVSKHMTIPNIAMWAYRKGIGLVATGDWTHPQWFREIERDLEEAGSGLLQLKHDVVERMVAESSHEYSIEVAAKTGRTKFSSADVSQLPRFLLATEVSCMYSQNGKGRRVHTLIWVPSIESARKIGQEMTKQGCNLLSDGRPIIGLTSIQVAELVFRIEPKALIIPAHCLLPDSMIIGSGFVPKRIDAMTEGNSVLTHSGEFHTITEVKKRPYKGTVFHIRPWYFRFGLMTTPEHPYYAIKTIKKCVSTGDMCRPSKAHLVVCKRKQCLEYKPAWVKAEDLAIGDILVYPRSRVTTCQVDTFLDTSKQKNDVICAGGTRGRVLKNKISITPDLGRLLGYFIAEGSTDGNNSFAFCFSEKEQEYIDDVLQLVKKVFGIDHCRQYKRKQSKGIEIICYSKLHAQWLAYNCYTEGQKHSANNKIIPAVLLQAHEAVQAECLRGWYRGDRGYTMSRVLAHQMKVICLRLGIIPSITIDTVKQHDMRGNHAHNGRVIRANHDVYQFNNFAYFENAFDLQKEMKRSQTKSERKHGWIDNSNIYIPIKEITKKRYTGNVYNLEVEKDHSYVTEYATVHNCWTPWFAVYGSMSGFDSIDEAFGPYAKQIYAVETGLSSNPSMNWMIEELDHRAIVSFSDAHSGPKLGREATVFDLKDASYQSVYDAMTQHGPSKIAHTIEFYPEEGKYHWSGHRACKIRWSPRETEKNGTACPVCGKSLTQGVEQRIGELSGRSEESLKLIQKGMMTYSASFPDRPPFVMLVPLLEIIAEAIGSPVASLKTQAAYFRLTDEVGTEFDVLLHSDLQDIARAAGSRVAEGVDRVRRGTLRIDPGYDGVFGVVKIWEDGTAGIVESEKEQLSFFS